MTEEEIKIPDNFEIDQALKEFERQSPRQQVPKAPEVSKDSGLRFETDSWRSDQSKVALPKMVQLVIKYSGGAIKDQKQAEYVLLGFVILAIGISLYLFFGGDNGQIQRNINPQTRQVGLTNKF